MEDDFEYHITFPEIAEPVNRKEPVIILFGWAGCIDRYLAKYSDIYRKKGYTSIRYVASPNVVSTRMIDAKKIHILAEDVIHLLMDMKFDKHPLFFHVFSNGGATVYRTVIEQMRKKYSEEFKINGSIFDSCPAKVNALGLLRATVAMTEGNALKRYLIAISAVFRGILFGIYSTIRGFLTGRIGYYHVWHALVQQPNICPELFLFSKADNVCGWETIQEFAEARKRKGVDVTSVLFEKSEHVKHIITYKEEYLRNVYDFIERNTLGETVPKSVEDKY